MNVNKLCLNQHQKQTRKQTQSWTRPGARLDGGDLTWRRGRYPPLLQQPPSKSTRYPWKPAVCLLLRQLSLFVFTLWGFSPLFCSGDDLNVPTVDRRCPLVMSLCPEFFWFAESSGQRLRTWSVTNKPTNTRRSSKLLSQISGPETRWSFWKISTSETNWGFWKISASETNSDSESSPNEKQIWDSERSRSASETKWGYWKIPRQKNNNWEFGKNAK